MICLQLNVKSCPGKKTKMFFVISAIKHKRWRRNLVNRFLNKFSAKSFKHVLPYLNSVSRPTLPCYLVKLEMLTAHVLPLNCYQKKLQNLSYCNYGLQIRQIRGGINFGVSFCYSSVVARVRRAFQVSQGSVETLFTWGGKRLHHFVANLFRKQSLWHFIQITQIL